ncbi:MAG: hypothetical protein VB853_11480 [Pirellulales bacterium]
MDPLITTLAVGPFAVYLSLIGTVNLSRRPFLTTGARDLYALGIGLSGFFIVGPMSLFMPEAAAQWFGGYVIWIMLIVFYSLCLTLGALLIRPRLVIYNVTTEQLRPLLASVVKRMDTAHQWAGDSLALPELGVQLHIEKFTLTRNVSLVATTAEQSYAGWLRLERELGGELRQLDVKPNPVGIALVAVGGAILLASFGWVLGEREAVAEGIRFILRF